MLEKVWRKGNLLHCWWECKLVQLLWRTVRRFLKKLEIELPYDPAIPLLGIHTKETRIERDTCTPMLIAALFTIARTWKQPRCPSADKWIKLWYIWKKVKSLSRVQLFATLWTVAHQAPPSMGFPRQEYWSGLPFPSPGDLPDPGIEPRSPALQADTLTSEPPEKHTGVYVVHIHNGILLSYLKNAFESVLMR